MKKVSKIERYSRGIQENQDKLQINALHLSNISLYIRYNFSDKFKKRILFIVIYIDLHKRD